MFKSQHKVIEELKAKNDIELLDRMNRTAEIKKLKNELQLMSDQNEALIKENLNLKKPEEVMILMKKYKVDFIEVDGVKINKSYHDHDELVIPPSKQAEIDEDELFYSAT